VKLDVITRNKVLYSDEVDAVVLPALKGEMGVLAGHADFVVMLKKGDLRLSSHSESRAIAIEGGYAEVSHDKVVVLPDAVSTTKVTHAE
jgi:F-type H+-transporting ATPase subunit epsilon